MVTTPSQPISGKHSLDLVHHITGLVFLPVKNTRPMVKYYSTWTKIMDHKSTWAALIAFLEWSFFTSVLLISKKDCQSIFWAACLSGTAKIEEAHDTDQYSPISGLAQSGVNQNIRKPRPCNIKYGIVVGKVKAGQALRLWLKDFGDCQMRDWTY
ncbi:hypothetical protein FRX31_009097 [Thalictrum thalictroides]|uniref:Uncharacterized protein n=1 Tax=Thalictrum thalictroides TaxID=46969 RepID=A0A7J6WXW1_THATH|nr:hypothetical protein FRX31_009097 [Thalictrum thalictroides]